MPDYLNWLSMVPGQYDAQADAQGIHQMAAGFRADTAQRERERAALEREEMNRRVQAETERATAFTEDKSLYDVDVAAFDAQQKNAQEQSKAQVEWLKENQGRLRDPIQREQALAENAALFPVADQSLQRPTFRGEEQEAAAPAGAEAVAEEAGPEPEPEYDIEAAITDALAGQTGIDEGALGAPQEGFGAPQGVTEPVSSTEQADLDDFLGRVAGGGQMGPPGMDAMVPTLPANLGVSSDPSQLRSPVQLPDGRPMPPQDILQSAPPQPTMPPPGMGVGAQPFGPSLTEQDAATAMQEAIQMGIMPQPPAGEKGPPLVRIDLANGEELMVDFQTPGKATADALQGLADSIVEGAPDLGKDAARVAKEIWPDLLKANGGDPEKTSKQMLEIFTKLSDFEKSRRNSRTISMGKDKAEKFRFYQLGLNEMNKRHSDTSVFGQTRGVIDEVYKGLQDVQSANPTRKNAALKGMVAALEERISDKDMDFAPGPRSIVQRAAKWYSENIKGTMDPEMEHRLEGALRAIYHDGMRKQRADLERVQQRINDSVNPHEKKGLMVAANTAFANYEKTKGRPNGFYTKYKVTPMGSSGSSSSSFRAKGLDPEQMRELETATADEIRGGL